MDEGKLWSLIRNVLSQGTVIQLDYAARRYEEYSARLDTAASERVPDFTKLADARIAELERECSQWRDELRIYRETEGERIAGLEQAVTVRDTEIARLETDLELVRRDVDHLRLFARIRFGYAPGDYFGICHCCKAQFIGDKRATNCEACADKAIDAARAGNGGGV